MRAEATGYGAIYFARDMLRARGDDIECKTCVVSGSGNVAIFAMQKIQQLGGTVVACSDSDGFVHDPDGIDLDVFKEVKLVERRRVCDYAQRRPAAAFVDDGNIWDVACQVAVPSATQRAHRPRRRPAGREWLYAAQVAGVAVRLDTPDRLPSLTPLERWSARSPSTSTATTTTPGATASDTNLVTTPHR